MSSARARHTPAPVDDGRVRVVIERFHPLVDGGQFPVKRVVGEHITLTADIFADGHSVIRAVARARCVPFGSVARPSRWRELPLTPRGNDEWHARIELPDEGWWEYGVQAWIDAFATWREALHKKHEAGLDVASELLEGSALVRAAAGRARDPLGVRLGTIADVLAGPAGQIDRVAAALDDELAAEMAALDERPYAVGTGPARARVERLRARYGAWYEMFPRSYTPDPSRGATLAEAASRLPAIAAMGFDVLYLPPIHPIGRTNRKGRNNALAAGATDPGSPWAIGGPEGGHTAIEPGLGTLDDFKEFQLAAAREGLEVALDLAYQCSPDHPWVTEHPEWFKRRPDGTIKYAENPPKTYQDIYPIDFDTDAWPDLWASLRDVIVFWAARDVRIFRVDNPHTKSLRFWRWVIADVQQQYPDVIFLSEAFTRPKIMRYLAKIGFTQSYTYFTWRNTKAELESYFTELTQTAVREYLRPNLFANTPDILHAYLQRGDRPAFQVRLILAATLAATYGIYSGFELGENVPVRPGSEEYRDSEKYEIKPRDWDTPHSLAPLVALVNRIRRENPALHSDWRLRFHSTDNPELVAYSKTTEDGANRLLVVVNLDPFRMQHGVVQVDATQLNAHASGFLAHDLLTGERYDWRQGPNYVRLDPAARVPAHILRIEDVSA
jgi:starch synthase (maltosyl-transferring)